MRVGRCCLPTKGKGCRAQMRVVGCVAAMTIACQVPTLATQGADCHGYPTVVVMPWVARYKAGHRVSGCPVAHNESQSLWQ